MDRERKDELPSMQVSFIDAVCDEVEAKAAGLSQKLQTAELQPLR